jgi:hypothetical protein
MAGSAPKAVVVKLPRQVRKVPITGNYIRAGTKRPPLHGDNLFLIIRRLTPTRYRVNLSFRERQDALSQRTQLGTLAERKLAGGILDASFARARAKSKYLT